MAGSSRRSPPHKTGKKVAVVGSGPAGLACAQQLARAGHDVHRLREVRQGRRPAALRHSRLQDGEARHRPPRRADGRPRASPSITASMSAARHGASIRARCSNEYDARGADRRRREAARDLPIPGRDLAGIHFAMDFLPQQNRRVCQRAARRRRDDPRRRQACRGDRRRRHRLGLHRHLVPAGRDVGDAARDHAGAARAREQGPDLAELAAEDAHLVEPGRRRASANSRC